MESAHVAAAAGDRIRIVLVEDNDVFREALELVLELRDDIEVVASVADGTEAAATCARLHPDVCLMDYRMPGLDGVQATLGLTPNLMRTFAAAPAALKGYLDLNRALAGGVLGEQFREQIALTVAQANMCEYCLAAHTALGSKAGLTPSDIAAGRNARALDARRDAGLKLAQVIVTTRGQVADADLLKARAAGLGDAEIVEIVANVGLQILSNYINHLAQTVVDFPPVDVALGATV